MQQIHPKTIIDGGYFYAEYAMLKRMVAGYSPNVKFINQLVDAGLWSYMRRKPTDIGREVLAQGYDQDSVNWWVE